MISVRLNTWEGEGGSIVEPPDVPEFELVWGLEPAPFRVCETSRCAPDHVRYVSVGFRLSPAMARVDRIALACVRWALALLALPLEWAAAWRRPGAP